MNDPREGSVPTPAHLAAEGLSYSVELNGSRRTILDDVGLRVERGSLFTVLGPSGSGTSTLLRCLNRLIEPDAGRVLLDGRVVDGGPLPDFHDEPAAAATRLFVEGRLGAGAPR